MRTKVVRRVEDYTAVMPADPGSPDLVCDRNADGVYTLQAFTNRGFTFLVNHHEAGIVDENSLRVPASAAFPLFNELFDEGLRVV